MTKEELLDRYYNHNMKKKGFPDKWISGALWVNHQFEEMSTNFKRAGIEKYTFEELNEAIKIGWDNYKEKLCTE